MQIKLYIQGNTFYAGIGSVGIAKSDVRSRIDGDVFTIYDRTSIGDPSKIVDGTFDIFLDPNGDVFMTKEDFKTWLNFNTNFGEYSYNLLNGIPSLIPLEGENVIYINEPTTDICIEFDLTDKNQGLSYGTIIYNGFVGNTHTLSKKPDLVIKGDSLDNENINFIKYEAYNGIIKRLVNFSRKALILQTDFTNPTLSNFIIEDDFKNRLKFDITEAGTGSTTNGFLVNGIQPLSVFINTNAGVGNYFTMPSDFVPEVSYGISYTGGSNIKDNAVPIANNLEPFENTEISNLSSVVDSYTTYHFDSNYVGNQNGSINEPFNNFDPITNNTIVKNKAKYLLKRNSIFKDSIDMDGAIDVIIDVYGIGNRPIVSGSQAFDTFTKTEGKTNVYEKTINKEVTAIGKFKVFENGILMNPAGSIDGCDITPNTYFRKEALSPSGNYTIQFHTSDSSNPNTNGKNYEIAVRGAIRGVQNTKKLKVSKVITKNQLNNNGSIDLLFGELDNEINDVLALNGDKHNALIGQGVVNNLTCFGSETASVFGGSTVMVVYTDSSNTAPFKRAILNQIATIQPDYLNANVNAIALYAHTDGSAGTVIDLLDINQFIIYRQGAIIGGSYINQILRKCFSSKTNVIDMGGIVGTSLFENFSLLFTGLGNLPFSKTVNTWKNGLTYKLRANILSNASLPAELHLENYTAKSDTVQISFLDSVGYVIPIISANFCVFNYVYNCIRTNSYSGDRNIFGSASTTTSFGSCTLSGANFNNLRKWQIATGQDTYSVEITKDVNSTFGMNTINDGDWRFNNRAVGRAGNLRLFKGTFADGLTPLALAGANDMPISHPTMPNSELEAEEFHEEMKTWYEANKYIRPIDIVHARVNNANRDRVLLVFSKAVNLTNTSALSLTFSSGTAKTITGIQAGNGTYNVWLQLSAPIDPSDVFTVDWIDSNTIRYVDYPEINILAGSNTAENRAYGTIAGLVAHYPFTANLNDVSGNNNTASAIGALSYDSRGVKFTASQNVITPPITLGANYTISFWLDYNNLAYATNIYIFGAGATSRESFKINRSNETIQWSGNQTYGADVMSGQYRNDTQIHYTIVRQGTTAKLYRFDELLATITTTNGVVGQQIYIGSDRATAQTFDGYIRSYKYFNTNLSDADVKKNFYSEL